MKQKKKKIKKQHIILRFTIWSLTFDSSLVFPIVVEMLEWKIQILWTGVD